MMTETFSILQVPHDTEGLIDFAMQEPILQSDGSLELWDDEWFPEKRTFAPGEWTIVKEGLSAVEADRYLGYDWDEPMLSDPEDWPEYQEYYRTGDEDEAQP